MMALLFKEYNRQNLKQNESYQAFVFIAREEDWKQMRSRPLQKIVNQTNRQLHDKDTNQDVNDLVDILNAQMVVQEKFNSKF